MALTNTINFLPEVFKSVTNQRFLGATLDQLATDAVNVPVHGYIGRTFSPTYKLGDNYVPEPTANKSHYQLEPSVVVKDDNGDVVLNSVYNDLLQSIANRGGMTDNQQRMFVSDVYQFDGHFDYDKFVNYHNYYWLPNGPSSVAVTSGGTPLQADYTVTRNIAVGGYTFSTLGGHPNTQITLTRGGTYNFVVDQPGTKFWIQTKHGVGGVDPNISTVSTRQVFGVSNNGTDSGVIRFNVPLSTAQDFYTAMPISATVDAAVTFNYTDIQNILLSTFLTNFPAGLDGITNQLQNKTFIFINNSIDDSLWGGIGVVPESQRRGSWRINLIPTGTGDYTVKILPTTAITPLQKVFVTSGKTYASTQFWLNNNYLYATVPVITATDNYLYYQDSLNPDFVGEIKLVDNVSSPININSDIIGKVGYTSPNGVVFTNGLKVKFDTLVVPGSYADREFYVDGVGTSIVLVPVDQLVVPTIFADLINTTADYVTINRGSQDRNAWSRTNRWFHKDVLQATATYNQTAVDYGSNIPGRRAIIEFEPNLQLFNYGMLSQDNIDLFINSPTDAFVDIEGQSSYLIDPSANITLSRANGSQGMRIVFSQDFDDTVKNKIWQVAIERINSQDFIRLIETVDDPVVAGEVILTTQGTNANKTFWFDGTAWAEVQEKTAFNQAPLFDLVDANGYSFSDATVYPSTTFQGTKFFGYPDDAVGTNDTVLGFPLKYQNFNNIGDIVFSNYYDAGTSITPANFTYTGGTVKFNTGYVVRNTGLSNTTKLTNWITGIEPGNQYQIITKFYEGYQIDVGGTNYAFVQIDVLPTDSATVPHLKVFLNNRLLNSNTDYQLIKYGVYNVVTLTTTPAIGDKIDVAIFSNETSSLGYYEVPTNLDFNPLNTDFSSITLGQVRTHYNKLIENTSVSLTTAPPVQDTYLKAHRGTLVQQSSPLIYAMTFMSDPTVNFVEGVTLARKEYQRFKNKFLGLCNSLPGLDYNNPVAGVDRILQNINSVKNDSFSWYYSDMVPQGDNYTTITYTVLNARQTRYEIGGIFDVTQLSNRAVLVYLNGQQLIGNTTDFSFNPIAPEIVFNIALAVGDVITIRDYSNTDGNFVPETPTKLGLYESYPPKIYVDNTYQTPTTVVRGHDGSVTPAFGDFRDNYLLELELRIYNNIKTSHEVRNTLSLYDTIPGRFRSTDYSLSEWNRLLTQNFLQWVGNNNIDYTTNSWFDANNPWTWNYNQFTDSIDGSYLQGSWRAVYNHWFDTDQPHLSPWRMLGIPHQPSWWATRYGPAPYTSGNTTLWEDLEVGYVWNGSNSAAYTDVRFARPGLSGTLTDTPGFIPVDSAGNLLDPTRIGIVKQINSSKASNSFQVGEQGPVETAWRRSSDYPYAIQQALALARPAEYFSTQLDLSHFYKNPVTGHFTNADNQTISPALLTVNGDITTAPGTVLRTAGYLNWIADYLKNLGIDPVDKIENYFKNFSVQLAYRVAGFTDKNLITVSAEQTSPGSTNASIIIPDKNYTVYLGKPVPTSTISYSAVIVTKTETGYTMSGYDTTNPFFNILASVANNQSSTITVNTMSAKIYATGSKTPTAIPYGTTFATVQQVVDFLISYQRFLTSQGFQFVEFDADLQTTRDWILSANEFLFWAQQGWSAGTLIVLNPIADSLTVKSTGSIVDEITNLPNGSRLLNTNFAPIKSNAFNVLRVDYPTGNQFQVKTVDGTSTIAFAQLNLIQYESTLIFDNVDDFGDIIYIPEQGTRQYRLKLNGAKTGLWTGALGATGYIYSNPLINSWQPGTDYRQGDIVVYNNSYYTAPNNISASQVFVLSNWTKIKLSDIQTGLLPSFGHNAQVFQNIYDVDNPPQDENFQIFSAGLIGFRERPFLSNLGMSIPTQTKFYQGYIKQKGTHNAVESLTKSTFDNVNSAITTYEEWAFQVGQYGDISNNQYTEFVLDQSVFTTNPVALTVSNTYNTGNIIVNLALTGNSVTSNVYNSSNLSSTTTSIYNDRIDSVYSSDLPSTGYVNLADIDYQIFDIATITTVPKVSAGNKIWIAKDFDKQWNVYRISNTVLTATTLKYTLDSYAQLIFDTTHAFAVGDYFVLQNFNVNYDGLYRVTAIPTASSITIVLRDTTKLIGAGGTIIGEGLVYTLDSVVVNMYSDIGSVVPVGGWIKNDRVWVNNDTEPGATGWAVYTYTDGGWTRTRQQQARVDINSINRTFVYNKNNNVILSAVDFIDPAKGKVLNAVGSDIDIQLTQDPALYNAGTGTVNLDYHWGPTQVGKIWWNLDAVRYIDYEQSDLIYRLNHWGETFPGSQILVYEWVESTVLPSQYTVAGGSGTPLYADNSAYSTYGYVDQSGAVKLKYYFWVLNKTTINTSAGKSNSVYSISAAIANPATQGIAYATVLRNDTVALYNVNSYLTGKNSVLHLGSKSIDSGLIHSEYALVQEGNPASQIPLVLERKLIDSLAGQDSAGNSVPDPALTPAQAYGVSIRPRQTMFVDSALALKNYITLVNTYLLVYPVIERKVMTTLNSSEPVPSTDSGLYGQTVVTYADLTYLRTQDNAGNLVAPFDVAGYSILVSADENQQNKWAIYSWNHIARSWELTRTQSYKTDLYWSRVNWYDTSYNPTVSPDVTVANMFEFGKLTLVADTHVKVLNNGNNQFVVYYINTNLNKNLVGIENGTVQISTGTIPPLELRQIATAIQTDILIDDLANEYNRLFFIMVKYALSEQKNLSWVFKTSFLSATQYIRQLEQFPSYVADNQQYYLDYINEVKPYRTVVREFVVDYQGNETYSGDATDFDLTPYWDNNLKIYRSPNGEQSYDSALLTSNLYNQWNNNYKYQVVDIVIESPGTGFLFAPQITISGGGGTGATAYSTINGSGGIDSIIITNPGSGYVTTPTIIINGTGTGALARAILRNVFDGNNIGHNVVRSTATTIKFDRITYSAATGERLSTVIPAQVNGFIFWSNISSANVGDTLLANTVVVNNNNLYVVNSDCVIDANVDLPLANLTSISSSAFNNANDRIVAVNGNVNLTLTQTGLEYPGVIVNGNTFVGNVFDSSIESFYGNTFGINPGEFTVDGGAYVGRFSSYAPEELVPGRMYDNLNLSVYDTSQLAFRFLDDDAVAYRIASANITTLTANLNLTDTTITVADATVLPLPSPAQNMPGVVFVNGEKIVYWRNYSLETQTAWTANLMVNTATLISYSNNAYITTGNVFDAGGTFANILANITQITNLNTLAQLRRGVDRTYTPAVHTTGSHVVDSSQQQLVPDSMQSNVKLSSNTAFQTTATSAISYGLVLTGNISANIGDIIEQKQLVPTWQANASVTVGSYVYYSGNSYITTGNVYGPTFPSISANVILEFAGNLLTTATLRSLQTISNSSIVPVILASGTIQGLTDVYDNTLGFDYNSADTERIASATAPTHKPGDVAPLWTANAIIAGEIVSYSGNIYTINGNVYAPYFANVVTAGNVTYSAELTAQFVFAGNTTIADLILQVGDQWWDTTTNQLYQWDGAAWVPYAPTNPGLGFDNVSSVAYVNGIATAQYITSLYRLGAVDANGSITVSAGTKINHGNIWYSPGIATPSNGQTLTNSTTVQANFLKAGLGFSPTPGTTP